MNFDPPTLLEHFLQCPLQSIIYHLYHLLARLGPPTRVLPDTVSLVCISDTHNNTPPGLPEGDILIHAGDLTNSGTLTELQAQIDWLDSLPYEHKVCIGGNHDTWLDPQSRSTLSLFNREGSVNFKSVRYLQGESATLRVRQRTLRIFGAPYVPLCGGRSFAFQYPRGQSLWRDLIPNGTDVVVTHGPPRFFNDGSPIKHLGCADLLQEVWRTKPFVHVFGHIHQARAATTVRWDPGQAAYQDAFSSLRKAAQGTRLLESRLWWDLWQVLRFGVAALARDWIWGPTRQDQCLLVNAAVDCDSEGLLKQPVRVVVV